MFITSTKLKRKQDGFTIPEVIVAGTIMIILCVGVLTTFDYAVKINRGNNVRMQALAVLQREIEFYRSLKFVPSATLNSPILESQARTSEGTRDSTPGNPATNIQFDIFVTITNVDGLNNATTKFKEIRIEAVPLVSQSEAWLQNLGTEVTIQRVRSN